MAEEDDEEEEEEEKKKKKKTRMMDDHRTVLGTLHHRLARGKSLLVLDANGTGRELCRRFLQNLPCNRPHGGACRYAHPDPKPTCEQWELYGTCKRDDGKKCWYAHESLKESKAFTIAFHTSTVFGLRLLGMFLLLIKDTTRVLYRCCIAFNTN